MSSPHSTCAVCKLTLPQSSFRIRSTGKPFSYCKPCEVAYKKAHYQKNAERLKAKQRKWSANNAERKAAADRAYRLATAERQAERSREWARRNAEKRREIWKRSYEKNRAKADERSKAWILSHPAEVRSRARVLKAHRKQAFVAWADKEAVTALYRAAAEMTAATGIPHEVDHIYPVRGRTVCGLHCEANLRVVPRAVNRAKGASMPEEIHV